MALRATPWRVHAVLPRSVANGPGERFTIWSQGCALACPGCFNPETHPTADGAVRTVGDLVDSVLNEPGIEGVTLTGGEPLEQAGAVAAFCEEVRNRSNLGIIVLTGFTRAEIEADPDRARATARTDLVIAGRYNQRLTKATGLRGSANKVYWDLTGRYHPSELSGLPDLEVHIGDDGMVTVTGMVAPGRDVW